MSHEKIVEDLIQALEDVRKGYQQLRYVMPMGWQKYDNIAEAAVIEAREQLRELEEDDLKPKYNSMFEVAFSIDHSIEDPDEIGVEELIAALQKRVDEIKEIARRDPGEAIEAFGLLDTYEHQETDQC